MVAAETDQGPTEQDITFTNPVENSNEMAEDSETPETMRKAISTVWESRERINESIGTSPEDLKTVIDMAKIVMVLEFSDEATETQIQSESKDAKKLLIEIDTPERDEDAAKVLEVRNVQRYKFLGPISKLQRKYRTLEQRLAQTTDRNERDSLISQLDQSKSEIAALKSMLDKFDRGSEIDETGVDEFMEQREENNPRKKLSIQEIPTIMESAAVLIHLPDVAENVVTRVTNRYIDWFEKSSEEQRDILAKELRKQIKITIETAQKALPEEKSEKETQIPESRALRIDKEKRNKGVRELVGEDENSAFLVKALEMRARRLRRVIARNESKGNPNPETIHELGEIEGKLESLR
jgi:hypothetical protein